RPHHRFGVGKGKDTFYEIGPMINLKVNAATKITFGTCKTVGTSACPSRPCDELGGTCPAGATTAPDKRCARVSVEGEGDFIHGILGLLDMAILKKYPAKDLVIVTDYDLCPGETFVRLTTRARFYGATGNLLNMSDLTEKTSLLATLMGQHAGIDCAHKACPAEAPTCDDLLLPLKLGSLSTEMKRCRRPTDKLSGVLGGDYTFFAAKAGVFIPGAGYDHETVVRSIFDTGGDIFSNPLSLDFIAAVADGVSYGYFNAGGKIMVPLFSASFTVSMTNSFACLPADPDCMKGKELVFRRFVSVGNGSVASALAPFYKMRGIPTATVSGHVIDERTRAPVSGIEVFAFRLPLAWQRLSDDTVAHKTYAQLTAAGRAETRSADNPIGEVGVISHFVTDPGLDTVPDGSFSGVLPVLPKTQGRLILVTRDKSSHASALVPLTLKAGDQAHATLIRPSRGTLAFVVQDTGGRFLPSKITIGACMPDCAHDADCQLNGRAKRGLSRCDPTLKICVAPGATSAKACRPDQRWDATKSQCLCPTDARLPLELHGRRWADGTVRTALTTNGRGQVHLPPGTYEVIASRGFEYEIKRQFMTLRPNVTSRFTAALPRVVDTKGWISGDFHVHGPNSVDASINHVTRVRSYVAEGVEFMSSSDHDYLTDYQPTIVKLRVSPWISSQIGVECSPLDYGHFLGFPLHFNENLELNGAFHWRVASRKYPKGWESMPPKVIFDTLRKHGDPDLTMVVVAHFYDHFAFYDLDPVTLEPPNFSVTSLFNPVLQEFSGDFDGLEALSGKNIDIIRRATYSEIRDYNVALAALLKRKDLTYDEIQAAWGRLSANAQREFLRRTPEEQTAALHYANKDFECRCSSDAECGDGGLCNEKTAACIRGCQDKTDCDLTLTAAGREDCLPKNAGDASRNTCQRVAATCTLDTDCTLTWGKNAIGPRRRARYDLHLPPAQNDIHEKCISILGRDIKRCELPCTLDKDCADIDPLRTVCDTTRKVCIQRTIVAATDHDPCVTVRGTVDDWFQLLNRGVRRTVMGNSDSHDVYDIEAGTPRNYIRSSTDEPTAIDKREIVMELHKAHSFATFGPFIQVLLNGQGYGETVRPDAQGKVHLAIRVQSPRWFDVDRLELYRNGELFKIIKGRSDCPPHAKDCLRVPNTQVVNYDAEIEDTPTKDSWYVVIAMGLDGKSMAPVYSSTPVARLGMFELIQRLTPLLPPLRSLRSPLSPSISVIRPYALTNPIYVDIDGDGIIKAVDTMPSWATDADHAAQTGKKTSPLKKTSSLRSTTPADSSPLSHDHRLGLGRLQRGAKTFMKALKGGKITRQAIQRAFDSLR
ncbi:MAG: hypothetical protein KAI47_07960, partial [Deltaproteobacteria bacterium]|nr:hypothetical protein [Deltaproteobacteria bacterium]